MKTPAEVGAYTNVNRMPARGGILSVSSQKRKVAPRINLKHLVYVF